MTSAVSVTLTNRKEVAAGTMAFHFEKPQGFTFKAEAGGAKVQCQPATQRRREQQRPDVGSTQ